MSGAVSQVSHLQRKGKKLKKRKRSEMSVAAASKPLLYEIGRLR
jgi:hypothetical protein